MSILELIETWARQELHAKNAARERALSQSRELVRTCANSIRAVHRGDFGEAGRLLAAARALSAGLTADLASHPDLYFTGYVQDAHKELVEASATHALVSGAVMPSPEELGIAVPAFLNGLAEAIGELRRWVLDRLRRGDVSGCESVLQTMDDIYSLLVTIDYPDALTGGLRRSTDVARSILERTRGDLTFALRQRDLEAALARVETGLGGTGGQAASLPSAADQD